MIGYAPRAVNQSKYVGAKHPIVFKCEALLMHGCFAPTMHLCSLSPVWLITISLGIRTDPQGAYPPATLSCDYRLHLAPGTHGNDTSDNGYHHADGREDDAENDGLLHLVAQHALEDIN